MDGVASTGRRRARWKHRLYSAQTQAEQKLAERFYIRVESY
jgi:hypothetical protein